MQLRLCSESWFLLFSRSQGTLLKGDSAVHVPIPQGASECLPPTSWAPKEKTEMLPCVGFPCKSRRRDARIHLLAVWRNLEQFCSLCPLVQVGLQRCWPSWAPSSGPQEGSREALGGPAGGQAGPKRGRADVAGVEKKEVRRRADLLCSAMFAPREWRRCLFTGLRSGK